MKTRPSRFTGVAEIPGTKEGHREVCRRGRGDPRSVRPDRQPADGERAGRLLAEHGREVCAPAGDRPAINRDDQAAQLIDDHLAKVEEWLERSHGKVRADVVHDKLLALGFEGSERTTRRSVAQAKRAYDGPTRTRFSAHPIQSRVRRAHWASPGIAEAFGSQASNVLPDDRRAALRCISRVERSRPAASSANRTLRR